MGSTVFFHNGFGDYIINRGALALLACHLPRPVRLIYGEGQHAFLVRDLPFDDFVPVQVSGPNGGQGRHIVSPLPSDSGWSDLLVNLSSWEGAGIDRLRAQLAPARYVWNPAWREWHADGPNAVQLAYTTVRTVRPASVEAELRVPLAFDAPLEAALDRMLDQLARQGYTRHLSVHLDSSEDKPWPLAELGRAVCALLARHPDLCVLAVGRRDRLPRCVCHGQRVLFLQNFSLQASMSVVARSTAFAGVDSVMMKVADVSGVSGVAVFATRRDAGRWGFFWTPARQVVLEEDSETEVEGYIIDGLLAAVARGGAVDHRPGHQPVRCNRGQHEHF
jgi:hypothetical protein